MRKSKKNLRKNNKRHKTYKKCVYTDETKRIIEFIKYVKKHNMTKKNKTT